MIKRPEDVRNYLQMVTDIRAALANLTEAMEDVPPPTDDNRLPTLHYGHLAVLAALRASLGEASELMDGFGAGELP